MISIIAAVDRRMAIGYQNKLLFWLPNDLKRFKALTTGHTIIMGRTGSIHVFCSLRYHATVPYLTDATSYSRPTLLPAARARKFSPAWRKP